MILRLLNLLALAVIVSAFMCCANADVVTVTPSNPGSWLWLFNSDYNYSGDGGQWFTTGGAPPAEGNPYPMGRGGFYTELSYVGSTSNTCDTSWIGLDMHNDEALAYKAPRQIKKLEYTTYVSNCWTLNDNGMRSYPREPFAPQMAVEDVNGNRRLFAYRPWGIQGNPHSDLRGKWVTYDAINMTSDPTSTEIPVWHDFWTGNTYTDWATLLQYMEGYIPDPGQEGKIWFLAPTSTDPFPWGWQSPNALEINVPVGEWRCTGTGQALSFLIGARSHSAGHDMGGGSYPWWEESVGFRGALDRFTLAIDYGDEEEPDIVETTYDFEPDPDVPAPQTVCAASIASRWLPTNNANGVYSCIGKDQRQFTFKFFGQVMTDPAPGQDPTSNGEYIFYIWDGSYTTVNGALTPATMMVRYPMNVNPGFVGGEYVSVEGYLWDKFDSTSDQLGRPTRTDSPGELTTNASNVTVY